MARLEVFAAVATVLACGCSRCITVQDTRPTRHVLTWRNCDEVGDDPSQAEYFFDGEPVGKGMKGIRKLKRLRLRSGSEVLIALPKPYTPQGFPPLPPYSETDLFEHWEKAGVEIVYDESSLLDPSDSRDGH